MEHRYIFLYDLAESLYLILCTWSLLPSSALNPTVASDPLGEPREGDKASTRRRVVGLDIEASPADGNQSGLKPQREMVMFNEI